MSDLRTAAQRMLAAVEDSGHKADVTAAADDLRAALAQQDEPCPNCASLEAQNAELDRKLAELEQAHGIIESEIKEDSHQTLDDAMRLPRAMAQAYENGYKAGVSAEREACAKVCESRFMGDMTREDMEARRCAAAIRARGEQL